MNQLQDVEIRDFRIRGNYFNKRHLLSKAHLRSLKDRKAVLKLPGYSPAVVEFELQSGATGSIAVREIDCPLLLQDDFENAKIHVSLIFRSRQGDSAACKQLTSAVEEHLRLMTGGSEIPQPTESRYVVPCTSSASYSESDISNKGFILLKLRKLGYPVPDFVILTAQAYTDRSNLVEDLVAEAIKQLEVLTMQTLGGTEDPLVFAIRCCMPHYLPGIMRTYLNVGVTESTLPSLEKIYGPVAARKIYLNTLKNLCVSLESEDYSELVEEIRPDLPPEKVDRLVDQLSGIVKRVDRSLVEDCFSQATFFVKRTYKHYEENQDLLLTLCRGKEHFPSLILQEMICTVRHDDAYAGVISSRHTQTGIGIELQTARNIFGEEIMTGMTEIQSTTFEDHEVIKDSFPAVYHFVPHLADLEKEFESPVTIEFAVEATSRYQWFALLQLNETGMAGRAAVISVVDLHKSGAISRKRVTELIRPYHIKQLTSDTIDPDAFNVLNTFCSGVAVLPRSAVSARVYFTEDAALSAKKKGEKVCFCKKTFVPTDTMVMQEMDAIISLTLIAIHVVTICQSLGIPALLSLERDGVTLDPGGRLINSSGKEIKEGDWITISSRRKALYEGKAKFTPARLLRYMKGEAIQFEEEERDTFISIAYAYRYYQQLVRGLKLEQISTLNEVISLVNLELRGSSEEAKHLVNSWFDDREKLYTEEVLKSDIGDHLSQSTVFEKLTLDRKIRFFKRAVAKCANERISGYEAGAFMLGRFLSPRYPVAFWKCFNPSEIGLLINEWILFEKYMQVLHNVGERKVFQTRKKILREGLNDLNLHSGSVKCLIPIKLSGIQLIDVVKSLPDWSDPQCLKVLELLQQPYNEFFNFDAEWSFGELKNICLEESLPIPGPQDT